jgi:predicted dinucleotide-binding enzyme
MNIGIIGTGNMGGNLCRLWARKGYKIMVTSADMKQSEEAAVQAGGQVQTGSLKELMHFADVIVFAFPYEALDSIIKEAGSFKDKIIIDIINPLTPDAMDLKIGHKTSAGEEVAAKIPDAKVVKAFNVIASPVLERKPEDKAELPSVFYCGDDTESKEKVKKLITDIGFEAIESGPLKNSRFLEPMAEFIIQLAVTGLGADIGFKLVKK